MAYREPSFDNGKPIPRNLSQDEIQLLDAVSSNTNPQGTLQGTLAKNTILLKSDLQSALIPHTNNLIFINLITALEAYLAQTIINWLRNNRPLLRRFVENNPQFRERKFAWSEIFTKFETIEEDAQQFLVEILWHDLGKAKKIYESVFGISFLKYLIWRRLYPKDTIWCIAADLL